MAPTQSGSGLPRDADALEALADMEADAEDVCEFAGHEWEDAGGGLEICVVCTTERWAV